MEGKERGYWIYLKSMHQEEPYQMESGSMPCFKYIIFAKQKPQLSFCTTEALLVFNLRQLLFNTDEQLDLLQLAHIPQWWTLLKYYKGSFKFTAHLGEKKVYSNEGTFYSLHGQVVILLLKK